MHRMSDVTSRFNELNLSDCRLLAVRTRPGSTYDDVELELSLVTGMHADEWQDATIRFVGCADIQIQIDTWGKRACGDAIGDNSCRPANDVARTVLSEGHAMWDHPSPEPFHRSSSCFVDWPPSGRSTPRRCTDGHFHSPTSC